MSDFQQKVKDKRTQSEDINQTSEPDSIIENILKLSDWEFGITVSSMLRTLIGKVHNMQK